MFNDSRSKNIIFLAHCILNQNSISDGTAVYPGSIRQLVEFLLSFDVGLVQLPCPELVCLGLDRGDMQGAKFPILQENTRIRHRLMADTELKKLVKMARQVLFQIKEYKKYGFNILGIIGIDRSPSCGVNTTSQNNREVEGKGLFMETLERRLRENGFNLPLIGIRPSEIIRAKNVIQSILPEKDILE